MVLFKPTQDALPNYQSDWMSKYSFLLVIIQILPFVEFLIVPLLFLFSRRRGKPKRLYHFVENEGVFNKIVNKRMVLSLAGGKLHTTSIMNPFLGKNASRSRSEFFVLVIESPDDVLLFEPIVNRWRIFHAYKWWKHLRREYTFNKLKDISFDLRDECCFEESKVIDGQSRVFKIAYIQNLVGLDNEKCIQKSQKRCFYVGEMFLSFFTFYIPSILVYLFLCCVFTGDYSYLTWLSVFVPDGCLNRAFLILGLAGGMIFLVVLYNHLRNGVINSR